MQLRILILAFGAAIGLASPAAAQWSVPPASAAFETPTHCPLAWKRYDACVDQVAVFTEAVTKARDSKRKLLVVFGADWCPWCRTIDQNLPKADYLDHPELKGKVDVVNIAMSVVKDGRKVKVASGDTVLSHVARELLLDRPSGGIPFFALIDPETDKLAVGLSNGRFATVVDERPANLPPEFRNAISKSILAMDGIVAARTKKGM